MYLFSIAAVANYHKYGVKANVLSFSSVSKKSDMCLSQQKSGFGRASFLSRGPKIEIFSFLFQLLKVDYIFWLICPPLPSIKPRMVD